MDRSRFFASVRTSLFGGSLTASQVQGTEAILDEAAKAVIDARWLAYMLATAFHETARTMQPVIETRQSDEVTNPTVDKAIARLESSWAKGRMPWVKSAYWRKDAQGKSWLGRGLVQLTHKANYERMGPIVGADLVGNPDLAMRDDVAVKIMFEGMARGLFTGKKLGDYFTAQSSDWVSARKIINGLDRANDVAGYAKRFYEALQAAA
ncbi:glycoside hydrolase family 19 protein [Rhizobium sp. 2MFCol3.1]|uniref:glycoside hydrolase family 19 protein n=1 Tax=Rhizobium sp. 2MFCol3.1 TaxID=1246459 RepID=UPI0003782774|nr:glycoside hydrolase family 19 protein [Rhizobium sp. 2MFCol3.1]